MKEQAERITKSIVHYSHELKSTETIIGCIDKPYKDFEIQY